MARGRRALYCVLAVFAVTSCSASRSISNPEEYSAEAPHWIAKGVRTSIENDTEHWHQHHHNHSLAQHDLEGDHHHCAHHTHIEPQIVEFMSQYKGISTQAHVSANPWRRFLARSDPAPIRIATEFQLTGLSAEQEQFMKETLMPLVTSQLSMYLSVKEPVVGNLKLPRWCATAYQVDGQELCAELRELGTCTNVIGAPVHNPAYFGDAQVYDCSRAARLEDCEISTVPGREGIPDTDFILYVTSYDMDVCAGSTSASGAYCIQDEVTGRPLAGFANFCPGKIELGRESLGKQIDLGIHEVLHGLLFSPSLFASFIDDQGYKIGAEHIANTNQIISPKVKQAVQDLFGCESLEGAGLEIEGGEGTVGSHWDARYFQQELMCAANQKSRGAVSPVTLALAEDSGWYVGAQRRAMPLSWGRGAGCEFTSMDGSCSGEEFCSGEENACTYDHRASGYCYADPFTDGCRLVKAYDNMMCNDQTQNSAESEMWMYKHGPGGRCIPEDESVNWQINPGDGFIYSRASAPGCYEVECNEEKTALYITMGGTTQMCKEGEYLEGSSFSSTILSGRLGPCPAPERICPSLACPADCSNPNGDCVDGDKCRCFAGYAGEDCSTIICTPNSCPSDHICSTITGLCESTAPSPPPSQPSPPPSPCPPPAPTAPTPSSVESSPSSPAPTAAPSLTPSPVVEAPESAAPEKILVSEASSTATIQMRIYTMCSLYFYYLYAA